MEDNEPDLQQIQEDVGHYVSLRFQLMRLSLYGKSARLSARLTIIMVGLLLFFFFLLFLAVTLALILGYWLHSLIAGFAILSIVYLILFLLIVVFYRTKIEKDIIDRIIQLLSEDEDE